MTTVVDPLGTPTPVYNRSGTTIVSINANGSGGSNPTTIPVETGFTIAVCGLPEGDNHDVIVPSGLEIGTVIEVYNNSRGDIGAVNVYATSGELIDGTSQFKAVNHSTGCRLTKTDASTWRSLGTV